MVMWWKATTSDAAIKATQQNRNYLNLNFLHTFTLNFLWTFEGPVLKKFEKESMNSTCHYHYQKNFSKHISLNVGNKWCIIWEKKIKWVKSIIQIFYKFLENSFLLSWRPTLSKLSEEHRNKCFGRQRYPINTLKSMKDQKWKTLFTKIDCICHWGFFQVPSLIKTTNSTVLSQMIILYW